METAWLVPLSLVFGLAVGIGATIAVVVAAQRGHRAAQVVNQVVPDGIDQVLDALESAGVVLDPSNNILKASPGAHSLGLVWNNALVHQELIDIVNVVRRGGETVTEELSLARGPFGAASIHLTVRVARLGSRFVLLLAEDRTESMRLDDVRRDFIANVSHELKTPIGAVSLLAEALVEASDDADQVRKFAKRLTKESNRLGRITQEIIELSRLQASDALTKAELVDIDLVSGGDAGTEVYGDIKLLSVALDNLVANAVQYSPDGSRVGIGVSTSDGVVEIAVTDQGIGIAEDERARVFERFYRSDPARSRRTGGSGLGLSIVKHVVENHGGDVRVWSQQGHGSTFTIRLPAASHAAAASLGENTA
jgi:two-component system, OmpR family, sensor histidine kinase SenX3